jgi:hypothetical protein
MSRDNNIALARRYYEECPPDDGDADKKRALRAVDELFAEDFVMYFNSATDAGPDIALDLVDSRADSKGVTIQVYRPTGRPQYATATT